MSNLIEHAKKELELIDGKDDEMQLAMNKHLIAMVTLFSEEGHSGFSAGYAIRALSRLLDFKPLLPLTGKDDEWTEVSDGLFQNKRCGSVFKQDGKAWFLDGKVFSCDGGDTWFTNRDSRVYITFPYNVPDAPERIMLESEAIGHE